MTVGGRPAPPVVLGAHVAAGLDQAARMVARDPAGAASVVWPVLETGVFRLAGLAVSHWMVSGAPGFGEHPLPSGSLLALGSAEQLLTFAQDRAPLFPTEGLALAAVRRLADTVERVVPAVAEVSQERLATARFDLAGLAARVGASRKLTSLSGALACFVRLRNLESHHAGRDQKWVGRHPDYHRLFAPLLVSAVAELFTDPDLAAPVHGWCVGRVVDTSGGMVTVEVEHPTLQRTYCAGASADTGAQVVVDTRGGATKTRIVMPFIDLAGGVPGALAAPPPDPGQSP